MTSNFWEQRYANNNTGWDLNTVSPPLKYYIDTLTDKSLFILIPGCGNAYEAEYLHNQGFENVFIVDLAEHPLIEFSKRVPDFPKSHILHLDFFNLTQKFDLILEQTFFCALHPEQRLNYTHHTSKLLNSNGCLVGLFFNKEFDKTGPPFGGNKKEYKNLFKNVFKIKKLENCYNSIKPRQGSELFFIFEKK